MGEIEKFARDNGWNTVPCVTGGPICRRCHRECIAFGFTSDIWMSPKGGFYHKPCALERLAKEMGRAGGMMVSSGLPKKFRCGRLTRRELALLRRWEEETGWTRSKTVEKGFDYESSMPQVLWVPGVPPGAWSKSGKCVCVMCGYVTSVTNICRQCPEAPVDEELIQEEYCHWHHSPHYMRKGDNAVPATHRSIPMVVVSSD